MSCSRSICPLSKEAIAQIKSSLTITSLNDVVLELLKNSLDADSTRINITVDYTRGNCSVEDNGAGILPIEFQVDGGLAKQYYTSKQNNAKPAYGCRGLFLHGLSTLSLLSITSRHFRHDSHHSITFNHSRPLERHTPAKYDFHLRNSKGTRVLVRDLFGNMPVRVKQRAIQQSSEHSSLKDWDELRKAITSLIIAWPERITVVTANMASGQKMRLTGKALLKSNSKESEYISHICSTLSQAGFLSSPETESWVPVEASAPRVSVQGAISLTPAAVKNIQLISLGIHSLSRHGGHNVLYEEINRSFSNSSFGNSESLIELGENERIRRSKDRRYKTDLYTNKELRGVRKGIDRWPMFCLRIEAVGADGIYGNNDDLTLTGDSALLTSILEVLRALTSEFLKTHHFSIRAGQPKARVSSATLSETRLQPRITRFSTIGDTQMVSHNMKLNSPARNPSPFHQWSRIKAGRVMMKKRLDNRGNKFDRRVRSQSEELVTVVSKSGTIVRPPFKDVVQCAPGQIDQSTRNQASIQDQEDETVSWYDSATKKISRVNVRTGLIVPEYGTRKEHDDQEKPPSCPPSIAEARKTMQTPTLSEPGPWIQDLLEGWENPVFRPAEIPIPQALIDDHEVESQQLLHGYRHSCSQLNIDQAISNWYDGSAIRMSKKGLRHAEVLSQVDSKFVLIRMPVQSGTEYEAGKLLVLVDQHAADERCRLEYLITDLFEQNSNGNESGNSGNASGKPEADQYQVLAMPLGKPISFDVPRVELELLRRHKQHFADWGILFSLPSKEDSDGLDMVSVRALPPGIIERCQVDPRLLVDLLRNEAWQCEEKSSKMKINRRSDVEEDVAKHQWVDKIHDCPQGILDMLISRSCRSAIMFNDQLSQQQCQDLILRLSDCAFPFQCAHGRPSMIPLVDIQSLSRLKKERDESFEDYSSSFKAWKQRLANDTPI